MYDAYSGPSRSNAILTVLPLLALSYSKHGLSPQHSLEFSRCSQQTKIRTSVTLGFGQVPLQDPQFKHVSKTMFVKPVENHAKPINYILSWYLLNYMPLYHILIRNTTWKNNTPVEPTRNSQPFLTEALDHSQRPRGTAQDLTWQPQLHHRPETALVQLVQVMVQSHGFCRNMRRCQHGWEGEHLNPPDTWLSGPSFLAKSCLNNGLASHWSPSPSAQRSARRPGWSHAPDSTPRRGLFGLWVLTLQKWPSRTPLQDLFERGRLFQSSHGSGWIQ